MSRIDRSYHLTLLGLGLVATVLPFFLAIDAGGRVAAGGLQVPGGCLAHDVLHTPCPGCGLTRGFVRLAHGDLEGASKMNRLALAMFLVLALQVPWRLWVLAAKPKLGPREERLLGAVPRLLVVALVVNWLWNATHGWSI